MQQVDSTQDSISSIILLIVGIGIAALVLIFISVLGGQTYSMAEADIDVVYSTSAEVNESFTADNTSWVQLDNAEILNGTISGNTYTWAVLNGTSFADVTANFTLNLTTGNILLGTAVGDEILDSTTCYVIYKYKDRTIREHMRNSIVSSFLALKQTGNYLPIVVLAVIIVIILGLIVGLSATTGYSYSGKGYSGGAL